MYTTIAVADNRYYFASPKLRPVSFKEFLDPKCNDKMVVQFRKKKVEKDNQFESFLKMAQDKEYYKLPMPKRSNEKELREIYNEYKNCMFFVCSLLLFLHVFSK